MAALREIPKFALPLCLMLAISSPGRAQSLSLERMEVSPGGAFEDLSEADLDGDGRQDLVFVMPGSPSRIGLWHQVPGGGFRRVRQVSLPPATAALALVNVLPGKGVDILALSPAGVSVLAEALQEGSAFRPWFRRPLLLPATALGPPRHWSFGEDVDGDGFEEVILPGIDHDWLVFGSKEPHPARVMPVNVPVSVEGRSGGAGSFSLRSRRPRTGLARIQGERLGPAWLEDDGLHYVPFTGTGQLSEDPALAFPVRAGKARPGALARRTEVELEDLDGDGRDDLIWMRTEDRGGGLPNLRTQMLFFLSSSKRREKPAQVLLLPGVLSSGPEVADVDGDGRPDVLFSIFAADARSEIARRLSGKVTLDWQLYLGRAGEAPLSSSPLLRIKDRVSTGDFDVWGLRNRIMARRDWDRDGRMDLLRVQRRGDGFEARIHAGSGRGSSFHFAEEPLASLDLGEGALSFRDVLLAEGREALRVTRRTSVVYFARRP